MTPEGRVKKAITDYFDTLIAKGVPMDYWVRQAGGFNYEKGIPDIFCTINGVHVEIEVKEPNGKLSGMQKKWMHHFESINTPCIVARSPDDVIPILKKLIDNFKID